MAKVRIPLVGAPHHRQFADSNTLPAISTLDQRFVNCIFVNDTNPALGSSRWRAIKRPGIGGAVALANTATGAYTVAQADTQVNGYGTIALIPSTTANSIRVARGDGTSATVDATGHVATSRLTKYYDSSSNELYAFHVVTAVAANRKAFSMTAGGTETEITDADYPEANAIGNFVFMDGYLFIATDTGRIYNSDLNSATAWTSTSFVTSQKQDQGRGAFSYRDKVGLFGADYIEFYENVGASTSPLQQLDHLRRSGYGLWMPVGSSNVSMDTGHFYLESVDTVFWINSVDTASGAGVFMLDGFAPKKISNPSVDYDLGRHFPGNISIRGLFSLLGQRYLVIATGDQATDYIWVYCLDNGTWTTWESALFAGAAFGGIVKNRTNADDEQDDIFVYSGTSFYAFDTTSLLSTDISYTDNAVAYTATIQTRNLDLGTYKRKRLNRLTLIGADSREASTCGISWSDDDGQTWSTARNVDLNDSRPTLTRLGMFRERQFRITNSSDAPMELEAMELEYDELAA